MYDNHKKSDEGEVEFNLRESLQFSKEPRDFYDSLQVDIQYDCESREYLEYHELLVHPPSPLYLDIVEGFNLLKKGLGYDPSSWSSVANHGRLYKLLERKATDLYYTYQMFKDDLEKILINARNIDIKGEGWCSKLSYTEEDLNHYHTFLEPYKDEARTRLSERLGYAPDLLHSLEAELYLRKFLSARDAFLQKWGWKAKAYHEIETTAFNPAEKRTCFDRKAAAIVKYREVLLTLGEEAADGSPIVTLF